MKEKSISNYCSAIKKSILLVSICIRLYRSRAKTFSSKHSNSCNCSVPS